MKRKGLFSLVAMATGLSLLVAAAFATAASSTSSSAAVKKGGTLNVNLSNTDVDYTDPALAYFVYSLQLTYPSARCCSTSPTSLRRRDRFWFPRARRGCRPCRRTGRRTRSRFGRTSSSPTASPSLPRTTRSRSTASSIRISTRRPLSTCTRSSVQMTCSPRRRRRPKGSWRRATS